MVGNIANYQNKWITIHVMYAKVEQTYLTMFIFMPFREIEHFFTMYVISTNFNNYTTRIISALQTESLIYVSFLEQ